MLQKTISFCIIFLLALAAWSAALVNCPDCSKPVSSRAVFCPSCGCPGEAIAEAAENSTKENIKTPDNLLKIESDGRTGFAFPVEYNAGTDPNAPDLFANSIASSFAFTANLSPIYAGPSAPENPIEVWELSARFLTDTIGISPDTDGDGMRDDWEIKHGLNPFVPDGHLDPDGDGRTNLEEYNAGTDPHVADAWSLSLLASSAFLTDTHVPYTPGNLPLVEETYVIYFEGNVFVCDTGGLYYDWDGDGIPNWWEARFSRSKTGLVATADDDGDGYSNYMEFLAYTDPTNACSLFAIEHIAPSSVPPPANLQAFSANPTSLAAQPEPASLLLTWRSAANRRYRVYASTDLVNWDEQPLLTVDGTGEQLTVEVPQALSKQFYKVTVDLLP
ncbi:MAG: hypothetical protein WC340_00220 [Kiritimatiellia bacterium]